MGKHAKKARSDADSDPTFIVAFALAWGIGGPAVGVAELALTGENLLDTGGRWQSWSIGVLASVLTFVAALVWQRRRAKVAPTKTLRIEPPRTFTVACSVSHTPATCPNCDASLRELDISALQTKSESSN